MIEGDFGNATSQGVFGWRRGNNCAVYSDVGDIPISLINPKELDIAFIANAGAHHRGVRGREVGNIDIRRTGAGYDAAVRCELKHGRSGDVVAVDVEIASDAITALNIIGHSQIAAAHGNEQYGDLQKTQLNAL